MPNQLAKSKRRQSLAEHEAVLAALTEIARREKTSVMALLRQAARQLVRIKASKDEMKPVRELVFKKAPKMPRHFKTAAQVARFKRAQREYDQVLLDLAFASPQSVQQRNSVAASSRSVRMINFHRPHATAASL